MFKNLTYNRKFQLLIAFAILFMALMYQAVFAKTIAVYKNNIELDTKLKEAAGAPARLAGFSQKLAQLDQLTQSRRVDTIVSIHDLLLGYVSGYCKENNTVLKSFPETFTAQQDEFEIQTHAISVQGSFIKLLQLAYLLEQTERVGKISSLNFQSFKDIDSKKTLLTSTIYIQNIKKIK